MEYNLPAGPGLLIVSDRSIAIVNEKYNQVPIDGGAGKIRKLDEIILDRMLSIGQKPKSAKWKLIGLLLIDLYSI